MVAISTPSESKTTLETFQKARRDFVLGKGSLALISDTYEIDFSSLKAKAFREKWTKTRAHYMREDGVLKLIDQSQWLDNKIDVAEEAKEVDSLFRAKQRVRAMLWRETGHAKEPVAERSKPANKARDAMLRKLASTCKDDEAAPQPGSSYYDYEDY